MGPPAGSAQRCARHQFSLRGATFSNRPLSGAGVASLRVHRPEVAQTEVEIHQGGARDWFCFAGLWRPMPEGGEAFTLLTTAPGPDVPPIHDRQVVVLGHAKW